MSTVISWKLQVQVIRGISTSNPNIMATCVPPDELIPNMMGSPFYESFSGLPPFADDDISPPASHLYDDDADSLDSVGEYNLLNRMEA
jgi:hypothetical protein